MSSEAQDVVQPSQPHAPVLRMLVRLAAPHRLRLALGTAAVLLATAAHVSLPALVGATVDAAGKANSPGALNRVAGILVLALVANMLLEYLGTVSLRTVGERVVLELRSVLFQHLLRLPFPYHQANRTGELLSTSASDIGCVQQALASVPVAVAAPLMLIGSVVLMFRANVRLTLLLLAVAPLMAGVLQVFGVRLRRLASSVQEALGLAHGTFHESIAGIETVQACANESLHESRYARELGSAYGWQVRQIKAEVGLASTMSLVALCTFIGVFWLGERMVVRGEITSGSLVSLLAYAMVGQNSVNLISQIVGKAQTALGALSRTGSVLALPLANPPYQLSGSGAAVDGDIRFESVTFRHAGQPRNALDDVSLCVPRGSVCALIGRSGAGKTTLARLLYRFYEPTSGRILIGDTNIGTISSTDLRRALAYVSQDPVLFTGTIRENILYSRPDSSQAEVEAAAVAAFADEFIRNMPDGYETRVGERGVTLSGGQRQRIAIARAILGNPKILVLDEATSALDDESERYVQRALERLQHGRTTLVIAHRATTIENADMIVELEQGRLIQKTRRAQRLSADPVAS